MSLLAPFFRILIVLGLVWTASRTMIYLLPGDPAEFLVHESLVQTTPEALRSKMDLDRPILNRIFSWPNSQSLIKKESSPRLVGRAVENSLILASLTLLLSLVFTGNALLASFKDPHLRVFFLNLSALLASIPIVVGGPILLLIFSVWLKIFPPVQSPILPAFTLAFYLSAFWFRTFQAKIDHFLPESPASGARARGISENTVFFKYMLAPLAGSFAAYFGTQIGILFNSSLLVEIIFQWPGIGSLLADSVLSRDYPVIELSLLVTSLTTLCSQQLGYSLQKIWEPKLQ